MRNIAHQVEIERHKTIGKDRFDGTSPIEDDRSRGLVRPGQRANREETLGGDAGRGGPEETPGGIIVPFNREESGLAGRRALSAVWNIAPIRVGPSVADVESTGGAVWTNIAPFKPGPSCVSHPPPTAPLAIWGTGAVDEAWKTHDRCRSGRGRCGSEPHVQRTPSEAGPGRHENRPPSGSMARR